MLLLPVCVGPAGRQCHHQAERMSVYNQHRRDSCCLFLLPVCVQVLLEGGATIELQDALGRSALMFAAGSDATAACNVLLEAHASLSARDRRGRAALDYAPAGR